MTSFSNVGEWEEVLGPRISGQVLTPARHLPGPPLLRFPTPFYLGWGGVCGGEALRRVMAWAYLTPMLFAHWLPVGGTACWPFDLSNIGGWTVSVGGEATGRCVTRDGLGVLDPDALCPLTPSRRDGLLAVRLESHRGLESRPSPLGGRFEVGFR